MFIMNKYKLDQAHCACVQGHKPEVTLVFGG